MTATTHIAVASLVRGHPLLRIAWGVLSHWIIDIFLHEYRPKKLYVTKPKTWLAYKPYIATQVALLVVFVWITRDWMAIVYGLIPDILDGLWIAYCKLTTGEDAWMRGDSAGHPYMRSTVIRAYVRAKESLTFQQNTMIEMGLLLALVILR